MTNDNKQAIRQALAEYRSELFPQGIFGQIAIALNGHNYEIELPFNPKMVEAQLTDYLSSFLQPNESITLSYKPSQALPTKVNNTKLIVAIASGKGGVGKSTVTSNLAVSLAKLGHKVGVLDADIYGPSIPLMFGLSDQSVQSKDDKTMEPFVQSGVALNSIGFLIPKESAAIWRGPMASKVLMQVVNETNWPELDVLLIDMPPGTGDIQLTISETLKCDGAVIVTTPQTVALADADKGIAMFNKVNTPILGLIENMSQFVCDGCGKVHQLFGQSGGVECARKHQVALLGQLPLLPNIRIAADLGQPFVNNPDLSNKININQYHSIAFSLMMQLSKQTESVITFG